MKTILVPTDFSKPANHALDFAYEIAKRAKAEIKLIHVIEQPGVDSFNAYGEMSGKDPMDDVFMMQLIKKMKQQLHDTARDEKYAEVTVHYELLIGTPHKHVANEVSENGADLVVMGTNGVNGANELFVGSNAERVVRYAKCPVVTTRGYVNPNLVKDIVFATNMQDDQSKVIKELKRFQELFNAEIHLVRINTPYAFVGTKEVKAQMQKFVDEHDIDYVTRSTFDAHRTEDGIIEFADDIKADMIAIATEAHTGIMHLLSGSIAEDLVNHSKRPVWTFGMRD